MPKRPSDLGLTITEISLRNPETEGLTHVQAKAQHPKQRNLSLRNPKIFELYFKSEGVLTRSRQASLSSLQDEVGSSCPSDLEGPGGHM